MDSDQGKLFIGGISWETSEERLSEYFGKYGQVLSAVIMKDKLTDKPRGFGFVAFADPSVLDAVLQDKHTIDGRMFITDNGSNFKAAGRKLEIQHPKMYWTPCAAHCINLILQEIGSDIEKIKNVLYQARKVVVYIYNHLMVLNMMRKLSSSELHRPCVTRFATSFYTLESIWKNMQYLQQLFVSSRWVRSLFSKREDGKKIARIIAKESFWKNVELACKVLAPLVDVLRLVDREEQPCMGYIYDAMDRAKLQLDKNLVDEPAVLIKAMAIVTRRWVEQLEHPLHAAGYYLNPAIFYKHSTSELNHTRRMLNEALMRLVPDMTESTKILSQLSEYREATRDFGTTIAIRTREMISPYEWWISHGNGTPELQSFARRVLSQTCSASPCERNWSAFDNVEAKRAMSREQQQNSRSANSNVRSSAGGDSGNTRTKKIFVGGLPPTITEDGLSQYFQTYGNVTDVVVMYDQATQRPRGFGFLSFDTEDAVDQVLHKTFHELDGKLVEVKRALPKDANLSSGGSARPMDGGTYQSYGASGANMNSYDTRTASGYMQPQASGGNYSTYGSSGYGATGYGYGSNNSAGYGGYGASGYGSGPAGAYGNPSATAIGYGSGHTGGPRSSWNNQAPTSYGSGGYGANTGYEAAATWNAPAGGGGNSVPTSQTPGGTTGYGNPTYGYGAYGGTEGSYGNQSCYGAVGPRGGAPVGGPGEQGTSSGGYGDASGNSAYSQAWRSDSSQGGGYGAGQVSAPPGGPTSYGGAYGSASRQPQQ